MKYRKKPVVIEAFQLLKDSETPQWFKDAIHNGDVREYYFYNDPYHSISYEIKTLEGTMRPSPGDYIIKGIQGEIYPCKPDIFQLTYEEEEDSMDENNEHLTSKEFRHVMGYLNDELVPMLVQSFENLDNRLGNVEQKMVELLSKEDEPIFTQEEKA